MLHFVSQSFALQSCDDSSDDGGGWKLQFTSGMAEKAIIANIATILTKDLLMDPQTNPASKLKINRPTLLPLLVEAESDEAFRQFLVKKGFFDTTKSKSNNEIGKDKGNDKVDDREKDNEKKRNAPMSKATAHTYICNAKKRNAKKDISDSAFKMIKLTKIETDDNIQLTSNIKEEIPTSNEKNADSATNAPAGTLNRGFKYAEINLLSKYNDLVFEEQLHVTKSTFLLAFQSLSEVITTISSKVSTKTAFSLAMWKLTNNEHFEAIAREFKISLVDCQDIIRRFWHTVSDYYESFIKWPSSLRTRQSTLDGFQKHEDLKCFGDLFGIISIKCLDIYFESEDAEIPTIFQIVVNADGQIIDCFVELLKDYSFDNSPIGQTLASNPHALPPAAYIIGNKCFPLKAYLMRPIDSECFRRDTIFNKKLESACRLAEVTFSMMAVRFNALYALEARDLCEVRQIIETICSLHNLCLDNKQEKPFDIDNHELVRSNWSRTNEVAAICGTEKDVKGLTRRGQLIDDIVDL